MADLSEALARCGHRVKRFGEYGLDLDRELEPPIQQMLSRRTSPCRKAEAESGELAKEA
jgi:hypothetical protein